MATQLVDVAATAPTAHDNAGKRYLIGPVADFLCFGGSSLIVLPLLLLLPAAEYGPSVLAVALLLAHVINNPHFAHSYQIFYRNFGEKAFTPALGRTMQARYLFAGIVVPIALFGFLAACIAAENLRALGLAVNAMNFFVGWHYVKQGYGLMMVDAALKRRFFSAEEKKLLLVNGYVVWIASWTVINASLRESDLLGIAWATFDVPDPILYLALAAAAATSAFTAWTLFRRWKAGQQLPVNGLLAYFVSLYPWMLFVKVSPLWVLAAPVLHSMQYLAVVWHFEANYEKARLAEPDTAGSLVRRVFGSNAAAHFGLFILTGIALGYAGFTFLPILLTSLIPFDHAVFGSMLFLFAAWIVINVHHYFMDNVMWRRENPDAKRYLFG
ncbi:MAG TPA: hypothetical protein VI168_17410 [Croceibacterium sp.]